VVVGWIDIFRSTHKTTHVLPATNFCTGAIHI
jgi:hypothetical protein